MGLGEKTFGEKFFFPQIWEKQKDKLKKWLRGSRINATGGPIFSPPKKFKKNPLF